MATEQETAQESVEALMAQWSEEEEKGKRNRVRDSRICLVAISLLFVATPLTLLYFKITGSEFPWTLSSQLFLPTFLIFLGYLSFRVYRPIPSKLLEALMTRQDARVLPLLNTALLRTKAVEQASIRRRIAELTRWAAEQGGIEAMPPLLALFEQSLGTTRRQAGEMLTRLLSRLRPEDLAGMTPAERGSLLGLFRPVLAGLHPAPALALLPLLPALDGRKALFAVANLLCENLSEEGRKMQEAARAHFPTLLDQAEFGGKERLGFWIEQMRGEMESTHWEQVGEPALAILQLLPRLSPNEFRALRSVQRNRLYALMANPYLETPLSFPLLRLWPPMVLKLLELVAQTNDQKAVPFLERVAAGFGFGRRHELRRAASVCLTALKAAKQQEAVGKVLLRASVAPQTTSAQLLRAAATGSSATESTHLLRPDSAGTRAQASPLPPPMIRSSIRSSVTLSADPSERPITPSIEEAVQIQSVGRQTEP